MASKRVRCPTCSSLLELQTPPYVQTIECPVCHEFNHFKLSAATPQPARVHSFPPPKNYYADTPMQHSYYRPTSQLPAYPDEPADYYQATAPQPPPTYSRPTQPLRPPYQEDMHAYPAHSRPPGQRPHPTHSTRPSMNWDNEPADYYRPAASPRPSINWDNKPADYYRPAASPRPSYYGHDEPVNYRSAAAGANIEQRPMLSYYRPAGTSSLQVVERPPSLAPTGPPVQPVSAYGKKRAVLCGVSYYGSNHELSGSVMDVKRMKYFLIRSMGYPDDCVLTLTEDEPSPQGIPTRHNILMALRWLVQGVQSGDSLVFYYCGLGSNVHDMNNDEFDGYDEALCPLDYETQGKIVDNEVNESIVRPLPYGTKLHAIVDASQSGTILDLPFVCRMNRIGQYAWEDQRSGSFKGTRGGLAVSITACDDDESTDDITDSTKSSIGSLTSSFIQAVENQPGLTYGSLLSTIRSSLLLAYADHEPQLSASEKIDIVTRKFIL